MLISSLSLLIGIRFSRECHCYSMVALISRISTLGITLSITVLVVGLSAINGFEKELKNRVLAVIPHGEIEIVKQPWRNWPQALQKVKKVKGINAVAPYINFTGLLENSVGLCIAQVRGVDPLQEAELSALPKFVQNSAWKNFTQGKKQIILGKGISDLLQAKPGDWISILIPNSGLTNQLQRPKRIQLQVSGIFYLNSQIDHNVAIIPIRDARSYLEMDDSITGIAIRVDDVFSAKKLVRYAGETLEKDVYIKSWISTYGYVYRDIQMIRSIMYLAMLLMISIACFNIVSTLIVAVKEKNSEIAILRALGAKNSLIRYIFIWYGILTGIKGSLFGVIIGTVVSLNLTKIVRSIEKLINYQFLISKIYFIDFLPSELHWLDIVCVLILTLLLSLAASWYPASRADHINPARELNS